MVQTIFVPAVGEATEADRCTAEVLDQIRRQKIRPEQRLGEVAFARKLKTGRAAVRVAFDRLAQVGILERIPNAGTFVRKVTLEEYCELVDVRGVLEGLAGRLACDRMDEASLNQLATLADDADRAHDALYGSADPDWVGMKNREIQFHGTLIRASGNQRIVKILFEQNLFEEAYMAGFSFPFHRTPAHSASGHPLPTHRVIAEAIRARKHHEVEQMLKQHVFTAKQHAISLIKGVVPSDERHRDL